MSTSTVFHVMLALLGTQGVRIWVSLKAGYGAEPIPSAQMGPPLPAFVGTFNVSA